MNDRFCNRFLQLFKDVLS